MLLLYHVICASHHIRENACIQYIFLYLVSGHFDDLLLKLFMLISCSMSQLLSVCNMPIKQVLSLMLEQL